MEVCSTEQKRSLQTTLCAITPCDSLLTLLPTKALFDVLVIMFYVFVAVNVTNLVSPSRASQYASWLMYAQTLCLLSC